MTQSILRGQPVCGWPKHVTTEAVGPGGSHVVVWFLPSVICAVVVGADWMKTVGVAIGSHIVEFLHLGASALVIACSSSGAWVLVFIVGHLHSHGGNGGGEFLDFRLHCQQFVLRLNVRGGVGC